MTGDCNERRKTYPCRLVGQCCRPLVQLELGLSQERSREANAGGKLCSAKDMKGAEWSQRWKAGVADAEGRSEEVAVCEGNPVWTCDVSCWLHSPAHEGEASTADGSAFLG